MPRPSVAVVGGGISGLAAAWELVRNNAIDVVILDAAPVVGGKLRTAEVAGHAIDVGSESMLARRPEALDLLVEAGLTDRVVHPRPVPAAVWSRGRLWPLPPGTVMGVPTNPDAALGVLTVDEVERVRAERLGPPVEHDVAVGRFVADRVGSAVVDRLVEPLLTGVYAGHAYGLSLQATVPALWTKAVTGAAILDPTSSATGPGHGGPVFAGYRGGLGALAADLARALSDRGVGIRTGATVRGLARRQQGWRLTVGPTIASEALDVDGVVLAVPAAPTARLLRSLAPAAAHALDGVEYASVAIVTLAVPRTHLLPGSGFLVPPTEPLTIKAATFSSNKWAWVADLDADVVLLRASVGRAGEVAVLQRDDAELVRTAVADLRTVLPDLPDLTDRPDVPDVTNLVDAHVQRWGGGLPQYAVGHLDLVATIMEAVARQPALGLAGAAYEGVGIPACVASGRRAARAVAAQVRQRQ